MMENILLDTEVWWLLMALADPDEQPSFLEHQVFRQDPEVLLALLALVLLLTLPPLLDLLDQQGQQVPVRLQLLQHHVDLE